MGEITTTSTSTRGKEGRLSSISFPMLNSTNYTVWTIRIKVLLKVHELWEGIEEETTNVKKNNMATALLFQSIPETLILEVGDLKTAKELWEAIKSRNMGADQVREARLQILTTEFDRLKMKEGDKIDDFVEKISEISSRRNYGGI